MSVPDLVQFAPAIQVSLIHNPIIKFGILTPALGNVTMAVNFFELDQLLKHLFPTFGSIGVLPAPH
jgi:hypothetical protein